MRFPEAPDPRVVVAVARLSAMLMAHVVPLFRKSRAGRPELVGTGFFVDSGKRTYLVSAAHVLDIAVDRLKLYYYVGPTTVRKVTGQLLNTRPPTPGNRVSDRLDVGVVRLEGPALPPYPEVGKTALHLATFRPNAQPREGKEYMIPGFPSTKARFDPTEGDVTPTAIVFRGVAADQSLFNELSLNPEDHILVGMDLKLGVFPDGSVGNLPSPHGMSGSPVWLLYDELHLNETEFTPLIGVVIEHHKKHSVIVATDIEYVIRLIAEDDA